MREILFRGIPENDIDRHFFADTWKYDCAGSFVYGSLIISKSRYYICVSALCKISCCINNGITSMIEVIPETVGQYTGLTDKNGKMIFEGDILKQKTTPEFAKVNSFEWEHYGIVRFGYHDCDEGEAGYASMGWYIKPLKSVSIKPKNYLVGHIQAGLNQSDILNKYYPMEVIGNIHDNPELLKEGAE